MKMDKVIAGLVVTAIGIWAMVSWWWFVMDVVKGLTAIFIVIAGLTVVGLGVKDGTDSLFGKGTPDEAETD